MENDLKENGNCFEISRFRNTEGKIAKMAETQGKSILIRVSARFKLAMVRTIDIRSRRISTIYKKEALLLSLNSFDTKKRV